ncbi:MAG: YaaL family protein [Christensenellaceae bacterium]|jgi:hypothetical protein|nr:YaaL family protein [Christensenellaceae bacterium]
MLLDLLRREDGSADARMREIEAALAAWKSAQRYFENVQDTDLVDFAIYDMEAARRKYVLLLRRYNESAPL